MVGAAIAGAAGIGAIGSIISGSQEASATNNATAVQQGALNTEQANIQPYLKAGNTATQSLMNLLGMGGAAGNASALTQLRNTPGYQFAQQQGLQGATNAATAQGMNLSGNTLQALTNYGTGLADQTYNNLVGQVSGLAGLGENAAVGAGNTMSNISNNIAGGAQQLGNIAAAQTAGVTGSLQNALNSYTNYNTLQNVLGGLGGAGGAANTASVGGLTDLPGMAFTGLPFSG